MSKKSVDPLDLIPSGGGYQYYCTECQKIFRYKNLKVKKVDKCHYMTCPECSELVLDLHDNRNRYNRKK